MKKKRLFATIFLLLVSGCNFHNNEKIFLSFEESENIVSENINFILNENKSLFEFSKFNTKCTFKSEDSSINIDSDFKFSGFLDQYKNKQIVIYPNIHFLDKKGKKEIQTSGLLENIYLDGKYFIRLSGMSVDMGKGNYESNLRYMIMENLGDKWINYKSDKFDNIKNLQQNISFIINTLSSSSVFENIEQVTYEGNLAYKISLKDSTLDFIKNQTNIEISGFEGLFIVKDENQVDLKINNMEIKDISHDNVSINIQGIIGGESGEIIYSMEGENTSIIYDIHRKYTNITIKNNINYDEIWSLNMIIYPSQKKETSKYDIKGELSISPIFIYGTDLEKELEINIKCLYENFSGENLEIKEPDSYILLDQILGDEFSIKNFIGEK